MPDRSPSKLLLGRHVGDPPAGTVVFLIGMRINRFHKPHRLLPVMRAMMAMLSELAAHPELGLLSVRTYMSGRVFLLVQYWKDAESLDRYASDRDLGHLPAWRDFNRRVRGNGDVGIFHETYVIERQESIYVNMPPDFGLGGATALTAPGYLGQRAAHRLDPAVADVPTLEPY